MCLLFLWVTGKKKDICIFQNPAGKGGERKRSIIRRRLKLVKTLSCLNFCQQELKKTVASAPRAPAFFLGFGIKNLLMLPSSFRPGRTATGINSITAAEAKPWAAFKSQTGQCSHILSALQRLLASC